MDREIDIETKGERQREVNQKQEKLRRESDVEA